MVSFIIVAKDKKKREAYVAEFAKKEAVDIFDLTIIEKDSGKTAAQSKVPDGTRQSIGIESVKLIQKKLFFKPLKSKNKILVIEDAQLLTPEAQNALLKVLEEPPAHTYIILATESKEALLPTILSRCQIIELNEEQKKLPEKTIEELNLFIQNLPSSSIGERLKQAEQISKDKEKAIIWIENLILVLRVQLLNNISQSQNTKTLDTFDTSDTLDTLKSLQSLHTLLKTTNVNPRFAIENTLLSL